MPQQWWKSGDYFASGMDMLKSQVIVMKRCCVVYLDGYFTILYNLMTGRAVA